MKYHHYLPPCSEGHWPARIICVDCTTDVGPECSQRRYRYHKLISWYAVVLVRRDSHYDTEGIYAGLSTESFWNMLERQSRYRGQVWVVSYQCQLVWSILGLWEVIENERVSLQSGSTGSAADYAQTLRSVRRKNADPLARVSAGQVSHLQTVHEPCLIYGSPPNIAEIWLARKTRSVTWVDILNYGVDVPVGLSRGGQTASWLSMLLSSVASTLSSRYLGVLRATAGAIAHRGWLYGYYNGGIYIHNNVQASAIEGRSYYGGRCECYRIGDVGGSVYHYDFRSMYPYIMANTSLPVRLVDVVNNPDVMTAERSADRYGVIADVLIETDEPAYPYIKDEIVIYPVGRFTTTLAGPELRDALDRNRIKKWVAIARYEMSPVLAGYAREIYSLRDEVESWPDQSICKLVKKLLVCLPGKLAQRRIGWTPVKYIAGSPYYGEWHGADDDGNCVKYRSIAGSVCRERDCGWHRDSCPAIASWITSAARVKLLNTTRVAGWENVIYVDTDCLFVDRTGRDRIKSAGLIAQNRLGYLQDKGDGGSFKAYGIKHYLYQGRLVCAGSPESGMSVDSVTGAAYVPETIRHYIKGGTRPVASERLMSPDFVGEYHHRRVHSDGSTTPWGIYEP